MTPDLTRVTWRKSSRSGGSGQCVEVALVVELSTMAVRDSKNPNGPVLFFESDRFAAFLGSLKTEAPNL